MKKTFALVLTLVMVLGMLSGCSDSIRVSDFDLDIGDKVTFGKYHGEEIEWEVIEKNFLIEEGKIRVELFSTYALDSQPFNENGESSWEDCSLRKWLNDEFYNDAFSKAEQKRICDTTYYMNTGDTRYLTDKVSLISLTWFRGKRTAAECRPTKYAKDQGLDVRDGKCRYWGRDVFILAGSDPSEDINYPLSFWFEGNVKYGGPDVDENFEQDDVGVRPVIWVDYKAPIERKDMDVGDVISFGTYSGDNMEWVIVDKDRQGITMISKYGMDNMRMDKGEPESFEETSLHDWLNGEFYDTAFTSKQQKKLLPFDNDDYVTLIGLEEMRDLIRDEYRAVRALYTGYYPSCYEDDPELEEVDVWWMRDNTPSDKSKFYVFDPGSLSLTVNANEKCSVRPMIKIEI